VIDNAPRPPAIAVDGFEAVARGVLEKRRVVIVGVLRARAGRPVIGKARVGASLREAVDVRLGRCDERDVDSPCDRMLLVGLREGEVPPDREARRARGLLDLELVEPP